MTRHQELQTPGEEETLPSECEPSAKSPPQQTHSHASHHHTHAFLPTCAQPTPIASPSLSTHPRTPPPANPLSDLPVYLRSLQPTCHATLPNPPPFCQKAWSSFPFSASSLSPALAHLPCASIPFAVTSLSEIAKSASCDARLQDCDCSVLRGKRTQLRSIPFLVRALVVGSVVILSTIFWSITRAPPPTLSLSASVWWIAPMPMQQGRAALKSGAPTDVIHYKLSSIHAAAESNPVDDASQQDDSNDVTNRPPQEMGGPNAQDHTGLDPLPSVIDSQPIKVPAIFHDNYIGDPRGLLVPYDNKVTHYENLRRQAEAETDPDARHIKMKLLELQFPPRCDRYRAYVISLSQFEYPGFGAVLAWINAAMAFAYSRNRTLIIGDDDWSLAPRSFCKEDSRSFNCFFHKISNCTETAVRKYHPGQKNVHNRVNQETADVLYLNYAWPPCKETYLKSHFGYTPKDLPSGNVVGLQWFRGQLARFAYQPLPQYVKLAQDKMKAIGYKHPVIGLHIRRGDKMVDVKDWNKDNHILHLILRARDIAVAADIPRVFLATDDVRMPISVNAALSRAQLLNSNSSVVKTGGRTKAISVLFDANENRDTHTARMRKGAANSDLERFREAEDALLNIMLLASSDFLVCRPMSYMAKIALLLRKERQEEIYSGWWKP
ncbi:hypothetical protein BDK51DRAFT_29026 [Blyttiomyces helicus]|uniref:Alpha-(1,6)-fucosyltransferase N- and catalytic domain-containing protein n=1 Tax=Blyttiomyces helicus TaxID=388810 RepID=A0A4P9WSU1_9FUNG|nr:hypothetical protein BDK51DRAFT_29026 [Blyttiomyces helicus]|eukprot:RKO94096.1 hypothetical protein BDK51DRAFT_29026 [Blyttiomyces helicus]